MSIEVLFVASFACLLLGSRVDGQPWFGCGPYIDYDEKCKNLDGTCVQPTACYTKDGMSLTGRCNKIGTQCCIRNEALCKTLHGGFCTNDILKCQTKKGFTLSSLVCSPGWSCCSPLMEKPPVDPHFGIDPYSNMLTQVSTYEDDKLSNMELFNKLDELTAPHGSVAAAEQKSNRFGRDHSYMGTSRAGDGNNDYNYQHNYESGSMDYSSDVSEDDEQRPPLFGSVATAPYHSPLAPPPGSVAAAEYQSPPAPSSGSIVIAQYHRLLPPPPGSFAAVQYQRPPSPPPGSVAFAGYESPLAPPPGSVAAAQYNSPPAPPRGSVAAAEYHKLPTPPPGSVIVPSPLAPPPGSVAAAQYHSPLVPSSGPVPVTGHNSPLVPPPDSVADAGRDSAFLHPTIPGMIPTADENSDYSNGSQSTDSDFTDADSDEDSSLDVYDSEYSQNASDDDSKSEQYAEESRRVTESRIMAMLKKGLGKNYDK